MFFCESIDKILVQWKRIFMNKTYDLLIVGNGYDLASGFLTSYSNYLESKFGYGIRNGLITFFQAALYSNVSENNEWNSFEKLLCYYLAFLHYLFLLYRPPCIIRAKTHY